jgi:TusA-related sulfurtransferase
MAGEAPLGNTRMEQSKAGQASSSATVLDVKGLKAPDNILAVLKKASELPNGSTLEFLIDSNPFQLYDLLQQRGFLLEMEAQSDGTFLGRVRPRDTKAGH